MLCLFRRKIPYANPKASEQNLLGDFFLRANFFATIKFANQNLPFPDKNCFFDGKNLESYLALEMSSKYVICDWCTSLFHRFTRTETPRCSSVSVDASSEGKGEYYCYYKSSYDIANITDNQNDIVMNLNVEVEEVEYIYPDY